MQVGDIPLMAMLKDRMAWLGQRQQVLTQNVANVDVPNYTPRDLKPMDFEQTLKNSQRSSAGSLMVTDPHHITTRTSSSFEQRDNADVVATPNGNSVSLEAQMIKVADTQAQYQAAANLYSKAISMMKVAIGRGGG